MRCLVIGYGSIGKRHATILKNLGCEVDIVTTQVISEYAYYPTIEAALEKSSFEYVIVCNPTYLHYGALMALMRCNYQGIVLVEKPLFSNIKTFPDYPFSQLFVAYNLRFHELLLETKKILANEKLITFSAYVGQYLPTWRKNVDYRQSYSAKKELGGGVLRDLSHELDYITWLCGKPRMMTAVGGSYSQLEINSDDIYSIMMNCEFCPIVNVQMSYLDRTPRRDITINTQSKTIFIDLMKGQFSIDGEIIKHVPDAMQQTYLHQHAAIIKKDFASFCSFREGFEVVKLIDAIEKSAAEKVWVTT